MTLADYLAQFLKTQGISHIFGFPGGENVTVIEAMRRTGLTYLLFHHEMPAGFAADVTGQLLEVPGVCMSTVGPGAVNLAAAAASATLERSPVLALTADLDSCWKARATHMKVDLHGMFGSVSKGSFSLTPDSAATTLARAWELALTPPRGAVHLAISPDLAGTELSAPPPAPQPAPPPAPLAAGQLDRLIEPLQSAGKLFILAGLGLEAAGAQAELLALAEKWQTPVAVTLKIKGHFPESHPLFAGVFTAYGDRALGQALAEADLVLGVGLDSVDFVTSLWDFATPLINLSGGGADDEALRPKLIAARDGDLKAMLLALGHRVARSPQANIVEELAGLRQALVQALLTPALPPAAGTIAIQSLIAALRQALPPSGAVTVDVGAFKLVFAQQWPTDCPKSTFIANGLAAMGYAVPGALAIRLAQPERPVVAIVGDGALLMYAGELATVARLGRPLVILVIVDEALSLIRLKQLRQAVPVYGTEFGHTDYAHLAAAFGLAYRLIDDPTTAEPILAEALHLAGPVLVEARIDPAEYNRFR
jgi:acetolactate synthase-1/2/3 large subunit